MASILHPTTTTTTLLLFISAISIATAQILDTDGEPLLNGGQYYIVPQSIGFGSRLAIRPKPMTSPCPLYIARDNDETSPGIPVRISSPIRLPFISPYSPINIVFKYTPTICTQSILGWQIISDGDSGKSYVATDGSGMPFNLTETFSIEQTHDDNVYKISHVGESDEHKDVGFFGNDGLLGVTDDIPFPIVFKKAFDVLAMV